MTVKKALNLSLVLSSLVGYLEWGKSESTFLFQAEAGMFDKALQHPESLIHPFTLLPLLGQAALLATLFQKEAGKRLTYLGIAGLGLLLGFMFVVGLISLNPRILVSTLPFLILATVTIRRHRVAR
ncbi:MAG: hypothetical protein K1Y01_16780 [Vicinamibacteria bacterium]|nr:hypothetical protein [Vicinamibacteria bacterium]